MVHSPNGGVLHMRPDPPASAYLATHHRFRLNQEALV